MPLEEDGNSVRLAADKTLICEVNARTVVISGDGGKDVVLRRVAPGAAGAGDDRLTVEGTRCIRTGRAESDHDGNVVIRVKGDYTLQVTGHLTIEAGKWLTLKAGSALSIDAAHIDMNAKERLSGKASLVETEARTKLSQKARLIETEAQEKLSQKASFVEMEAREQGKVSAGAMLDIRSSLVRIN